ncbi:flagellar M-ring protein FliF [Bacillaceae bacterium Marseille-Q3522]|nr:flagellar M-ring protein FliF [Bacillaceae bacterium Marseille-Q3522]
MNQKLRLYISKLKEFWLSQTKKRKIAIIGIASTAILISIITSILLTRTTFEPLYSNLTPSETGSIKESLDNRGIESQIADGGTTIKVPAEVVDSLKVELAAEGLPKSGSIDYSFFSQNAGIGMTENEFNVLKLDSMQTELANLIKEIDGIKDAKVMINLPEKGIFVADSNETASASIVLNTEPGYQFDETQINALYHLVSKSVPNLPTDNIVITNQFFEYFDQKNNDNFTTGSSFATQNEIKKQIERDVQRQVQNMLATLMGQDKVMVSVTADMDFTQENREEINVTPVDEENMEGIAISAHNIAETFTGNGENAGGIPEGENPADTPGTQYLEGNNGNGDYERTDETINYEVNRIRREIVESPYKIRDLGIQVIVEPPVADDPTSLPQARVDDIRQILNTIVRTTIDKESLDTELTDNDLQEKIAVSVQPFNGKTDFTDETRAALPWWIYFIGALLLAALAVFIILFYRARRSQNELVEEEIFNEPPEPIVPDVNEEKDSEAIQRKKQLEKMAKEKPEDFAKLLRSWLSQD